MQRFSSSPGLLPTDSEILGFGSHLSSGRHVQRVWDVVGELDQHHIGWLWIRSAGSSGGMVTPSVSGQQGLVIYTGSSFSNGQYAQARFVAHSSAAATGVCVRMTVSGSGVCYLADWEKIIRCLTAAAAIPLPQVVPFRQAVTRYDFLWLEQPTPVPTSPLALLHPPPIQPIQLEVQPYWWTNAGLQSMRLHSSRPTAPPPAVVGHRLRQRRALS